MSYSERPYATGIANSGLFPAGVKWLLISNIAIFVVYFFASLADLGWVFEPFGLRPADVVGHFAVWQFGTYLFLHNPFGFTHILFNMLTLWMFGADLERTWGTRRFLNYYFATGIGAGICVVVANLLFGNPFSRTIGSSGAIYGLLLAFGMLYPDRKILFSFLFPIKAKYFVMILGAIAFMSSFDPRSGGVSHVAHLGGMLVGILYLRSQAFRRRSKPVNVIGSLRGWYEDFKVQRAKKKFQVYLKKHGSDRDRYVH